MCIVDRETDGLFRGGASGFVLFCVPYAERLAWMLDAPSHANNHAHVNTYRDYNMRSNIILRTLHVSVGGALVAGFVLYSVLRFATAVFCTHGHVSIIHTWAVKTYLVFNRDKILFGVIDTNNAHAFHHIYHTNDT